jgi:hypothetical protein
MISNEKWEHQHCTTMRKQNKDVDIATILLWQKAWWKMKMLIVHEDEKLNTCGSSPKKKLPMV